MVRFFLLIEVIFSLDKDSGCRFVNHVKLLIKKRAEMSTEKTIAYSSLFLFRPTQKMFFFHKLSPSECH